MTLFLQNNNYHYELENVARMFFWQLTVEAETPAQLPDEYCVAHAVPCEAGMQLSVRCRVNGREQQASDTLPAESTAQQLEHRLAVLLFEALSELTGFRPPFGVMTGIRPAKYTAKLMQQGMTGDEAEQWLQTHALLAPDKAKLCRMTAESGIRLGERIRKDGFSLYVSIPFCPSRCSYCSFVSKSVERDRALVQPYVDALCKEIAHTADITKNLGLTLQTVYIGGGTPSVLTAEQLQQLTSCIAAVYPFPSEGEYSVEAGRPETITEEKLRVLKAAGVTRISINPQTGNDEVLRRVGRKHTAADITRCYEMARAMGFDNINADLIAGLPGDDLESFKRTLDWVQGTLQAENITVHALTLKRASTMRETVSEASSPEAAAMVSHAFSQLTAGGWAPYYMYRQKGTVDSLENTGYSKAGYECLYNLFIMDELQSIVACGAGAVTKLRHPETGVIERVYDLKYPLEYMQRFDEMLSRKDYIGEFYSK